MSRKIEGGIVMKRKEQGSASKKESDAAEVYDEDHEDNAERSNKKR